MALRSLLRSCGTALLFTDRFFAENTPRSGVGVRVVGAVAVLHVVWYYGVLFAGAVLVALKGWGYSVGENIADLTAPMVAGGLLLGPFVVVTWLLVSAVLHVGIKLQHGEGTFGDTLFVVGWAAPTTVVTLLFWGGGFLLAVAGVPLVMSYDSHIVTVRPAAKLAGVGGGIIALLWQASIWPTGLQYTHNVERRQAVLATVTVVLFGGVALLGSA